MAADHKNYIRDLSEYLTAGNLSDLTVTFGEKRWQIHKALACCHSKWFHKALTAGFKETISGEINLHDDPEFANALDCMVSYFYNAGYHASKYDTSASLLHAQVAVIADKYDCPTLYKLAKTSFAKSMIAMQSDDWVTIAAFIYDYTTTEVPTHVELRKLVVAATTDGSIVSTSMLQDKGVVELLRSNADLATDLLLMRKSILATSTFSVVTVVIMCTLDLKIALIWGNSVSACRADIAGSARSESQQRPHKTHFKSSFRGLSVVPSARVFTPSSLSRRLVLDWRPESAKQHLQRTGLHTWIRSHPAFLLSIALSRKLCTA
ncbi:uncharacterized protein EI97DRAFT_81740 [Westerdykella ornata]|uniref:BTB domain-containing protein n=1 Tax=Westerdykella ornata TaxID=318751 RepID=A0A6A6JK20_WESOR|nr:uncharacterized protein EI97DRAFT_81740 [Westerdykella ornata]KAF2275229.1 hypothetical protein EI97DRAFT_81740 [Westerdykella ornata]